MKRRGWFVIGLLALAACGEVTAPPGADVAASDVAAPLDLSAPADVAALDAVPADMAAVDVAALDVVPADVAAGDVPFPERRGACGAAAQGLTAFPWAGEGTEAACSDGDDNDGNGYADCDDFGCSRNVALVACGAASQYEGSPDACRNGRDDDGDRLVDCADPDCAKNPYFGACPLPCPERGCADGGDTDGDGFAGCDDLDCLLADTGCAPGDRARILFDQSLDETAAAGPNSDWVVDAWAPFPHPSNPQGPNEWDGSLSSFGYALVSGGDWLVESVPSWSGRLTYGDRSNAQDLSRYDVLALVEPSRAVLPAERAAIHAFVEAGGGLLLVANHLDSDRDGNGTSAPEALNSILGDADGPDYGILLDEVDIDTPRPLQRIVNATHPVITGPAGTVVTIGFYKGCSAHLTGTNGTAVALVLLPTAASETEGIAVAAAEVGAGRVVIVTDSAIAGDGSDSHGTRDPAHDSWNDAGQENAVLFLNAVAWLGRRGS